LKPDTEKQAKAFAATFAVTLSDKQYRVFVEKLAAVLQSNYEAGLRDGALYQKELPCG
jgi:hypothetical protein